MRIPCEMITTYTKDNGCMASRKTFSYVALLCEKEGSEVKAVRLDGYTSKYDTQFQDDISGNYPDWNLKGIWKLYDEDFS